MSEQQAGPGRPRYEVPIGVEIAAQWAWRTIVIAVVGLGIFYLLRFFSEVTVPIAIAILGTALTIGAVDWLDRHGVPRVIATFLTVILLLVALFGALALVGQQLAGQFDDLRSQVIVGISEVQKWAQEGPLKLSDSQISGYVDRVQSGISNLGQVGVVSKLAAFGTSLTHFLAGFFIALFATFFFLYDGKRIWSFVVVLFPRAARDKVHSSGQEAWHSLTSFVRATVLVALVDALGIAISAWVLGVPLAFAIGVLVFIGAFVPVVGAFVSGLVAVLVALVAQGPIVALFMLLAVVVVQQLEAHVLQPFLLGRFVSVHPLAIILAIAAGITLGGIVGALVAVPVIACLNGVVRHLAAESGAPLDPDGLPNSPPEDVEGVQDDGATRLEPAAETGNDQDSSGR